MYQFDFVRATSVSEAASALAANPDAKLLAGGQTLLPTLKQRLAQPSSVVDLAAISDLKSIRMDGNTVVIGAMTTHAEVEASGDVKSSIPALAKLAGGIGDPQVRHRGTLGGSLANNDPSADYPAAVLALNAVIVTNKRQISADDYFAGMFTTALQDDEIMTEVRFPQPAFAGYAKIEQRASRYPLVGVFVARPAENPNEVRVAVTGAGADGVFRSQPIEAALAGNFTGSAARTVSVDPSALLGDLHGSAEYRAALISVLAQRAVDGG
ncbi:MAG: FAD binding domain-containing protein [Hyphomicrobiaceae bacterium]